jgi:hypothetical protein
MVRFAVVTYCIAIGFILAVAFHSPSKTLVTASATAPMPAADLK